MSEERNYPLYCQICKSGYGPTGQTLLGVEVYALCNCDKDKHENKVYFINTDNLIHENRETQPKKAGHIIAFCRDCTTYGIPFGKEAENCGNCNGKNLRFYEQIVVGLKEGYE
jgi:hypothetical protein